MDKESKWIRFKKDQLFEYKTQVFFTKYLKMIDYDPRPFVRALKNNNYIKGIYIICKDLILELLFFLYNLRSEDKIKLDRPIFMIGLPHSGTTISMKLFAKHPDVNNFSEMNTLFHTDDYLDMKNEEHHKNENHCNPKVRKRLKSKLQFYNWLHGNKPRVFNKNPNNTVTPTFLKKCFPDCYIIHVIRDGRAVVNSLMHGLPDVVETFDRYKPPNERVNPYPGVRPINWKLHLDQDPIIQHAKQWNECISYIESVKEILLPNYIEVKYEDLCANPRRIICELWKKCGLNVLEGYLKELPETLTSRNYKYKLNLSVYKQKDITEIMKINLNKLNYE